MSMCTGVPMSVRMDSEVLPPKAHHPYSSTQRIAFCICVFACAIALIAYRDPSLFYSPRFWAEEGTVYYYTAYVSPVWVTLLSPHQGYYSLWANIAGLLATLVPVETAPAVGTGMALLVTMAIIFAILINDAPSLDTPLKKIIASFAAIVVGSDGEIWLASVNSQHFMALLVFLALIDSKTSGAKRPFWYSAATIAGLTSTAANFLTPLFLLKYTLKRQKSDLVLFLILCATSVLQVGAIVYSIRVMGAAAYFHPSQSRFSTTDHPDAMRVLDEIRYYIFYYPIFGFKSFFHLKHVTIIANIVFVINLYLLRRRINEYWYFVSASSILVVISTIASLGMTGGGRYIYAASVIAVIGFFAQAADERLSSTARYFGFILVATSLAYWSFTYRSSFLRFHEQSWPSWSSEVSQWRQDPSHEIQSWPIWPSQTEEGLVWKLKLPSRSPAVGR